MNYTQIIDEAGRYVTQYMNSHTEKKPAYHNLDHTKSVVANAIQIANHYQLNDADFFTVVIAAWFHDIGYYTGTAQGHEERGAGMAAEFLQARQAGEDIIANVRNCIMATKMPVDPVNLVEKILCDADTWHLGTPDFRAMDALVWQELELRLNKTFDHKAERTLHFLEMHTYHTSYCQQLLDEGKRRNKEQLKSEINP